MKYWHINCLHRQAGEPGIFGLEYPGFFNGKMCRARRKTGSRRPDTGLWMPLTVKVWIFTGDLRYAYIRKEKQTQEGSERP
ncbi:hypothetical protein [Eisenbergiella sp.]